MKEYKYWDSSFILDYFLSLFNSVGNSHPNGITKKHQM